MEEKVGIDESVQGAVSAGTVVPAAVARVRAWSLEVWSRVKAIRFSRTTLLYGLAGVAFVAVAGAGVVWYLRTFQDPAWYAYSEVYRLVPETVSASAGITISLPEEAPQATEQAITITPEISGTFVASHEERVLRFQPAEPLAVGSYYTVAFAQGDLALAADLLVVDDPHIVSILPSADAEVHEATEVSVIFNRPMVPISSRAIMDEEAVPVRLEPSVPGTWQWKSTRLLQFTPEEDLVRGTTYTVTVNEGFRSLDGVAVPGFSHSFTTRTLKHEAPPSTVRFDSPLEIVFNQEVDLSRTAAEVKLFRNGEEVEPIVSYASVEEEGKGLFGLTLFSRGGKVDKTRLWVRPKEDMHGREGFWDFGQTYDLSIPNQYPAEGDIVNEEGITWNYAIPEVLSSLAAVSKRSDHVEPMFFDPEGELVATFFEPIDLARTKLLLEGVRHVAYGTECRTTEEGRSIMDPESGTCVTQENKKELRITVDPSAYPRGKETTITFERVVSEEGLELARDPIVGTVRTVPDLVIYKTVPETSSTTAALNRFTICSNTPLARPESMRDMFRTEGYVVYPDRPWRPSYRVSWHQDSCNIGEFETSVEYGLHPERGYEFALSITDAFGARYSGDVRFTTRAVPSIYTRFHNMQKWYNVTVPGKTRLTYAVENLPAVAVQVCKVSPETMLRVLDGLALGNKFPDATLCESSRLVPIDLPDTYWVNNYFHFDIKDHVEDVRGHYILTFTHANFRDERGVQRYDHTLLSVSNLTVGEKSAQRNSWGETSARISESTARDLYWVLGANTLDPIFGAQVTSYVAGIEEEENTRGVLTRHAQGTTDSDGVARLQAVKNTRGAVVRFGGDTAVVSARTDTLMRAWGSSGELRTYLYTDRPIYRPGDSVHVRGIDRVGSDQKWQVTEGYTTTLKVIDSRGEAIHTEPLTVSRYGTFDTTVTLPADASLGGYSIQTSDNGYGWFEVEEYAPAPFKAEVTPVEAEYVAGDKAIFDLSARYYFDMPVADASVEYTVLAQDYHFDRYVDEYFSFGKGWYSCYWCGYGDSFITRGTVTLDAEGAGRVEVPLDFAMQFENPDKEGSKVYTLIARVTDRSGKQIAAQNSVIVHRGEYYLGAKVEPYVLGAGQDAKIRVKSVDTQGKPVSLDGVSLTVFRSTWESFKRREVDGGYYWHSEEVRTPVFTERVRTDKDGNASVTRSLTEPGSYVVTVERVDSKKNPIQAETSFYVWGEGDVSVRPMNNESLTVVADRPSYRSGEEATILAESPFSRGRALVTVERGDIYQHWSVPVSGGFVRQTIPLVPSYTPTVHASVLLVGPGPEVKYGSIPLQVNTDEYTLGVEATPDKRAYLPGEDVVLTVRTKDAKGAPVSAEVSLAVVDLSVLALVGNPKKDPVGFFYGGVPLGISTAHSAKNMLVEMDIPAGTKGGGGGEDLERRKRGEFKDTAHWSARVVTNEAGEATVRFTLPDNLTTWQVESLGVTPDTRLGVHYTEFTSKKRLMAIPIRPRFVVPGDTLSLGMQIMNNTDESVTVRARITSNTLTVRDAEERTVRVPAGGQEIAYFDTEAPVDYDQGSHTVTFHAVSDGTEDVVEGVIPIRSTGAYEVTATAGMTSGTSVTESVYVPSYALAGRGELTVQAQATLVGSLLSVVKHMAEYPYGCSEQIASRLASLSTITHVGALFGKDAMQMADTVVFGTTTYSLDEAVRAGLRELLGRQRYDGGFSFYVGTDASVHLTVEVLSALTVVRDAGYEVPDQVFARGAAYVVREITEEGWTLDDPDTLARVVYALSSPYVPAKERVPFVSHVEKLARDPLAMERLNTLALGYLTLATGKAPYRKEIADLFFKTLENRLVIDARGAYVKGLRDETYSWFESNEKNTALFVLAVAERGGEHVALENTLRWLKRGLRDEGGWGSTNTTASVLNAAVRLAQVRKEHTAVFDMVLTKNVTEAARYSVGPATLMGTLTHAFPLDIFARNRIERVSLRKEGEAGAGSMYYEMQLRYMLPPDLLPPRDEGFTVERALYARNGEVVRKANVGELVTGKVTVTVPRVSRAVSLESFVPAGFEIVNVRYATEEGRDLAFDEDGKPIRKPDEPWWAYMEPRSGPRAFPVTYEELHDDRAFVFAEEVRPGIYVYEYTLRALVPGIYRHKPATVSEMYTPEVFGRSDAGTFEIVEP